MATPQSEEIGKRIKERRELLGMSQEELALKVGYTSRTTIVKIEKGENNLRQTKIVQFAKALECDPIWLAGLDDETEEQEGQSDSIVVRFKHDGEKKYYDKLVKILEDDSGRQLLAQFIDILSEKIK